MSNLSSVLPPNTSAIERALETVLAERTLGLEIPVGRLWDVDKCPADFLPWLAWTFSVEVWEHEWPEEIKREVVREAVAIHRLKGTRQSVERVLKAIGYEIELEEWFEYGGPPHTFRVTAFGGDVIGPEFVIDPNVLAVVKSQIEAVKPVRSHMELRIAENFGSDFSLTCGLQEAHSDTTSHDIRVRSQTIEQPVDLRSGIQETTSSTSTLEVIPRYQVIEIEAPLHVGLAEETQDAEHHDIKRKRLN